jgi:hypothetical protein
MASEPLKSIKHSMDSFLHTVSDEIRRPEVSEELPLGRSISYFYLPVLSDLYFVSGFFHFDLSFVPINKIQKANIRQKTDKEFPYSAFHRNYNLIPPFI